MKNIELVFDRLSVDWTPDVNHFFDYSPEGRLVWRVNKSNVKAGTLAGYLDRTTGYMKVRVDKKDYPLHRLIFLWHHGYLPVYIDHIDGNTQNNKIENLRAATCSENQRNSKIRKDSKTGVKGVCVHKSSGKFTAQLKVAGNKRYLGLFDTIEDAEQAIRLAREQQHGDFARHE